MNDYATETQLNTLWTSAKDLKAEMARIALDIKALKRDPQYDGPQELTQTEKFMVDALVFKCVLKCDELEEVYHGPGIKHVGFHYDEQMHRQRRMGLYAIIVCDDDEEYGCSVDTVLGTFRKEGHHNLYDKKQCDCVGMRIQHEATRKFKLYRNLKKAYKDLYKEMSENAETNGKV